MRAFFSRIIIIPYSVAGLLLLSWVCLSAVHAQSDTQPEDKNEEKEAGFLEFNHEGKDQDTNLLLDQQNRKFESGDRSPETYQRSLLTSQQRAAQMVELLKNEQLQRAMSDLTEQGNLLLEENPELKSPLGIIAAAAGLWYGRAVRLLKVKEVRVFSSISARSREGNFSLQSPLLDGRLRYQSSGKMEVSINRTISSINTTAELNYNGIDGVQGARIYHRLAPNLDLTFGTHHNPTSRYHENSAGVNFHIDF